MEISWEESSTRKHERQVIEDPVDVIESELHQYGYRFIRFLGEGGYAKVVLVEILPEKFATFKADADLTRKPYVQSVRWY
jgi:hypothetical protein